MDRVVLGVVAVVVAVGCGDSALDRVPVEVLWMEWPAEVLAGAPFSARLTGYGPGCYRRAELRVPMVVDVSSVTMAPYFLVEGSDMLCVRADGAAPTTPVLIDVGFYDTTAAVAGLPAPTPRTYEMRAAASVYAPDAPAREQLVETLPVRTFGEVAVRTEPPLTASRNVGGYVFLSRESATCTRAVPAFLHPGFVVENPPPGSGDAYGFVRGYLHTVGEPVCGETRLLHVVSWN